MVRGCEKKIVRLGNPDSRYFEEVLFILRDDAASRRVGGGDIVAEAKRILSENTPDRETKGRRSAPLLLFLLGAATSAVALLPLALL